MLTTQRGDFIPGLDKPLSRLVIGTGSLNTARRDSAFALLDEAYELGCRTFDTAHVYQGGDSERMLGAWIRARGVAEDVVVVGKGCVDTPSPEKLASELLESLERLQLEAIDLYLLHRDNPSLPVATLVEALNGHRRHGRIRTFGGSNWTHDRLAEANRHAEEQGLEPLRASSPHFSLALQLQAPWPGCISVAGPEHQGAREFYARTQLPLLAWSPLAGGFFSGRCLPGNASGGEDSGGDAFQGYLDQVCRETYGAEDNFRRLERAESLGQRYGLNAAQVALAYVLSQEMNVFAVIRCGTPEHLRDCVRARSVTLTEQELRWLESGQK